MLSGGETVGYDTIKDMLLYQTFARLQDGRYWVAVSILILLTPLTLLTLLTLLSLPTLLNLLFGSFYPYFINPAEPT
jgi:hypothetical protein